MMVIRFLFGEVFTVFTGCWFMFEKILPPKQCFDNS